MPAQALTPEQNLSNLATMSAALPAALHDATNHLVDNAVRNHRHSARACVESVSAAARAHAGAHARHSFPHEHHQRQPQGVSGFSAAAPGAAGHAGGGGRSGTLKGRSLSRSSTEQRLAAREAAHAAAAQSRALQDMAVDSEGSEPEHDDGAREMAWTATTAAATATTSSAASAAASNSESNDDAMTAASQQQSESERQTDASNAADRSHVAGSSDSHARERGEAGDGQPQQQQPDGHSSSGAESAAGAPTPSVMAPTADSESILADVTTLILFDWDDTLLASSHLASSGYRLDDPDTLPSHVVEQLSLLEDAVIPVLTLARSLGTLCIITNAETGWVELSCKKFMPRVVPHLEGLHVLSARSTFESRFPGLPAKWKLEAFTQRICALPHEEPKNVISLGDSTAERDAVRTVTSRLTDIFTKSVKFVERPTIEQLWRELQLLRRCLQAICATPDDLDLALTVQALAAQDARHTPPAARVAARDFRSSHPSVARQQERQSVHAHVPCPMPV